MQFKGLRRARPAERGLLLFAFPGAMRRQGDAIRLLTCAGIDFAAHRSEL
jgi:hypothetical protein